MSIGRVGVVAGSPAGQRIDDRVFEYTPRITGLHAGDAFDIAFEPDPYIDLAVIAEARDGFAGLCIDRRHHAAVQKDQPSVGAVLALPVVHAA